MSSTWNLNLIKNQSYEISDQFPDFFITSSFNQITSGENILANGTSSPGVLPISFQYDVYLDDKCISSNLHTINGFNPNFSSPQFSPEINTVRNRPYFLQIKILNPDANYGLSAGAANEYQQINDEYNRYSFTFGFYIIYNPSLVGSSSSHDFCYLEAPVLGTGTNRKIFNFQNYGHLVTGSPDKIANSIYFGIERLYTQSDGSIRGLLGLTLHMAEKTKPTISTYPKIKSYFSSNKASAPNQELYNYFDSYGRFMTGSDTNDDFFDKTQSYFKDIINLEVGGSYEYYEIYSYWDGKSIDNPSVNQDKYIDGLTDSLPDALSVFKNGIIKSNSNTPETYYLYIITQRGHTRLQVNIKEHQGAVVTSLPIEFTFVLFSGVKTMITENYIGLNKPFTSVAATTTYIDPYSDPSQSNVIFVENNVGPHTYGFNLPASSASNIIAIQASRSMNFNYNGFKFNLVTLPKPGLKNIEVAVTNTTRFNLYELLDIDQRINPAYIDVVNSSNQFMTNLDPTNVDFGNVNNAKYSIYVYNTKIAEITTEVIDFSIRYSIMEKVNESFNILEYVETSERLADIQIKKFDCFNSTNTSVSNAANLTGEFNLKITNSSVASITVIFLIRGIELPINFPVTIISDDAKNIYIPAHDLRNKVTFYNNSSNAFQISINANGILKKYKIANTNTSIQTPYYNIIYVLGIENTLTIEEITTELLVSIQNTTNVIKQYLVKLADTLKIKTAKQVTNHTGVFGTIIRAEYEPKIYALQNPNGSYTVQFPFTDITMGIYNISTVGAYAINEHVQSQSYTFMNSAVLPSSNYNIGLNNYEPSFTLNDYSIADYSGYFAPITFINGKKEIVGVIKQNSYSLKTPEETLDDVTGLPSYVNFVSSKVTATIHSQNIDINYDLPIIINDSLTKKSKILIFKVLDPVDTTQNIYYATGEKLRDVLSNDPFYFYYTSPPVNGSFNESFRVNLDNLASTTTIYFGYAELRGKINLHLYNGQSVVYGIYLSRTVNSVSSVRIGSLNSQTVVDNNTTSTYSRGGYTLTLNPNTSQTFPNRLTITKSDPSVDLPEMFINNGSETWLYSFRNLPQIVQEDVYVNGSDWIATLPILVGSTAYSPGQTITNQSPSGTNEVVQVTFNSASNVALPAPNSDLMYNNYESLNLSFNIHFIKDSVENLYGITGIKEIASLTYTQTLKYGQSMESMKKYSNPIDFVLTHCVVSITNTGFSYTAKTPGVDNFIISYSNQNVSYIKNYQINCLAPPLDSSIELEFIDNNTYSFPLSIQNYTVNPASNGPVPEINIQMVNGNAYTPSGTNPSLPTLNSGTNIIKYRLGAYPSTGNLETKINVTSIPAPATFDSFRIIPSNSGQIKIDIVNEIFNSLNGNFITSISMISFEPLISTSVPLGDRAIYIQTNSSSTVYPGNQIVNDATAIPFGSINDESPIRIDPSRKFLLVNTRVNGSNDNQGTYTFTITFEATTPSKNFLKATVTSKFEIFVWDPSKIKQEIIYTNPNVSKELLFEDLDGTTNATSYNLTKIEYDGMELKGSNDDVLSWGSKDKFIAKASKETARIYFVFMTYTTGGIKKLVVYKLNVLIMVNPETKVFSVLRPSVPGVQNIRYVNLLQEYFPLIYSQMTDIELMIPSSTLSLINFPVSSVYAGQTRTINISAASANSAILFSLSYTVKLITAPTLITNETEILIPIKTSHAIKSTDISPDSNIIIGAQYEVSTPSRRVEQTLNGPIVAYQDDITGTNDFLDTYSIGIKLQKDYLVYPETHLARTAEPAESSSTKNYGEYTETKTVFNGNVTFAYELNVTGLTPSQVTALQNKYIITSNNIFYRADLLFYDPEGSVVESVKTFLTVYDDEYGNDDDISALGFSYNGVNFPLAAGATEIKNNYITVENVSTLTPNYLHKHIRVKISKEGTNDETTLVVKLSNGLIRIYNVRFLTATQINKKFYVMKNESISIPIQEIITNGDVAFNIGDNPNNFNLSMRVVSNNGYFSSSGLLVGECLSTGSYANALNFKGHEPGVWKDVIVDIYSAPGTVFTNLSTVTLDIETLDSLVSLDKYVSMKKGENLVLNLQEIINTDIGTIQFSNWRYSTPPNSSNYFPLTGNANIKIQSDSISFDGLISAGIYGFKVDVKSLLISTAIQTINFYLIVIDDTNSSMYSTIDKILIETNPLVYPITSPVVSINGITNFNNFIINNVRVKVIPESITFTPMIIPISNFSVEIIYQNSHTDFINFSQVKSERDITSSFLDFSGNIFKNGSIDKAVSFNVNSGLLIALPTPSTGNPIPSATWTSGSNSVTIKSDGSYTIVSEAQLTIVVSTLFGDSITVTTGNTGRATVEIDPYPEPQIPLGNFVKVTIDNVELKTTLTKPYATFTLHGNNLLVSNINKATFPENGVSMDVEMDSGENIEVYSKLIKLKTANNKQIFLNIPINSTFTYLLSFKPEEITYNEMFLPGNAENVVLSQQGNDTVIGSFTSDSGVVEITVGNKQGTTLPIGFYDNTTKTITYLIVKTVLPSTIQRYTLANVQGDITLPSEISSDVYAYASANGQISNSSTTYLTLSNTNIIRVNEGIIKIVNRISTSLETSEFDFNAVTNTGIIRSFRILNFSDVLSVTNPYKIRKFILLMGRPTTGTITYSYYNQITNSFQSAISDSEFVEIPISEPLPISLKIVSPSFHIVYSIQSI